MDARALLGRRGRRERGEGEKQVKVTINAVKLPR